jgi:branched-chain amino acid transport system permease protein
VATTPDAVTEEVAPADERDAPWRPTPGGWAARITIHLLIFGGVLFITAIVPGYWAFRISLAAIYAMIGLSINIVLGYAGQVSLGHHGFVGIAAFASAYFVTVKAGCVTDSCPMSSFALAVLLAALTGAISAGLLGLVALRIRGLYLALITLAYGLMAERSIFQIPALTGGGAGQPAPRPNGFTGDTAYAFLCFGVLAILIFVDWRLFRSKVGRAILSVRHSEPVASSYGVNVTNYKVLAFVMSGMFAGIAGAMFGFRATQVQASLFDFATSLLWVLMVVVGGLGNRVGVILGSAFFALFPYLLTITESFENFFQDTLHREEEYFTLVIGAALALLTIIQYPGGIAQQVSPITRWLGGNKFGADHGGHGGHKPKGDKKKPGVLSKLKRAAAASGDGDAASDGTPSGTPEDKEA